MNNQAKTPEEQVLIFRSLQQFHKQFKESRIQK